MPEAPDGHYQRVATELSEGRVVPLLGAGANLCGRPADTSWSRGKYLPSGDELAEYLAKSFHYPGSEVRELVRVSQYVAVLSGSGPLYEELRKLFDADYPPTSLHEFLAGLPSILRSKRYPNPHQLIVTANYDDAMERALRAAGEEFDLVSYIAEGENRGKFWHVAPDSSARVIETPNEYRDISPDRRSVILKFHGAINRGAPERDSFVITEDDYIDYLTRTDISSLVPITLAAKLRKSHFLFLGYSMRDWNLRVILHRIWGQQVLTYKSWAIQLKPLQIDQELWRTRGVDILDVALEEYVERLSEQVRRLPDAEL